jgi:GTP-binding protein EngB required for normal cell division
VETSLFNQIRRNALELLTDASNQLRRWGPAKQANEISKSTEDLLDGRLTTAVVGEFKRGKSTLLGALVEQPALFPRDVDIATNLVTSLEHGSEEQITAFIGDATNARPVQINRQQIPEYVTEQENPHNTRNVQMLRIESPIRMLETGLVLLDTPGAGGLNTEHTAVTHAILGTVSVAVFVIDAMTPLNDKELELLETVTRQAARLLVVITKIDKVTGYEIAVRNARLKLDELLGADHSAMIPIIPVSSTAKLDWLRTGDEESLEVSNFAALEAALWDLLTEQGGAILISRAMSQLVRTLDDVRAPLQAELVALTAERGEVDRTAARLEVQFDRLGDLAAPGASWRGALIDEFDEIRSDANERLIRELEVVADNLDRQLDQPKVMQQAETLLADLERDVTVLWSALVRDLRRKVADLSDRVEVATGVRPNPVLSNGGVLTAFETFGRPDRREANEPGAGFKAIGWLGEVLSYVIDDFVVYAISQVATFFGVRSARVKQQRQEFAEDVRDQLRRADRELRTILAGLLDNAETSVMRSFDNVIEADRDRVRAAHQAMRAEHGSAAPQRIDELNAELRVLADLRARAMAIADNVTGPDRTLRAA